MQQVTPQHLTIFKTWTALLCTALLCVLMAGCASVEESAEVEGVDQEEFEEWDPRSENVTGLQAVTNSDDVNHHPKYAGGDKLLFSSDRDGVMDVWRTSITGGGGTRQLTDYSGADVRPGVHPNGENFTFISERGTSGAGVFMGSYQTPTATSLTDVSEPAFAGYATAEVSPDGSKVVYASGRHIWTYNMDQNTRTQMVTGHQPSWYRDGEKIVFVRKAGEVGQGVTTSIWTMDGNGRGLTQLKSSGEEAVYLDPSISPDGERICYTRAPVENEDTGELGNRDIWIADADGSNEVRLTTNPLSDIEPTWIGNNRIAFSSRRPQTDNILDASWNIWLLSVQ